MFSTESTILSAELKPADPAPASLNSPEPPRSDRKKIILIAGLALALIVLVLAIFLIWKYWLTPSVQNLPAPNATSSVVETISSGTPATLPDLNAPATSSDLFATSTFSNSAVEYLTFSSFYKAPDNKLTTQINNYELPLNVKIDVMNYYDVSRKINLDPVLATLDKNGFATIANPWPKEAPDFSSFYSNLNSRQLPLLITADFLLYYQQNIFKKVFKDVEENVFYDNLWDINKLMYTVAKNRYEARLAAIGDVNDSVLEGERLETAYFAVALTLLRPTKAQIAASGQDKPGLFTAAEADRFYFVAPPYLSSDVLAEVKLIREAKSQSKSPVLLYARNYNDFIVPADYLANAKLNNFYLTTAWLNSVFPLNYRGKDCPNCLLDQADWRINLTAASLMAQDFSSLPELKNKWARIYKVMSFFKGLREDLDYVHYRDALSAVFGANSKPEELFADQNKQAPANLEKLRRKLLTDDFPEISGGYVKADPTLKPKLGFKLLAESYWPNTYIFSRLTAPAVSTYLGTSTKATNVTACQDKKTGKSVRCNGFAFDLVNLVYPVSSNDYFSENTNYANYASAARGLSAELNKNTVWHLNNYWLNLSLMKSYLGMAKNNLPVFAQSVAWQDKSLETAAAAWINLQLPLEKFSVAPAATGQNLDNFSRWSDNSYVEPNLNLLDELLADNNMLLKMFTALQLEAEVPSALQNIRNFSSNLESLRPIVLKELNSEKISEADNELIADFTKQLKTTALSPLAKQLAVKLPSTPAVLREDLSRLRLLVLIHQEGDNKVFSVGPVWDYQELH